MPSVKKHYKKNFLKQVIFRLDFPTTNLNFLGDFYNEIKTLFPFQNKQEVINVILQNPKIKKSDKNNLKTPAQDSIWIFENAKKTKKIHVASGNLIIEYTKYNNKKELLDDIELLTTKFFKHSKIETINRVGLRYSNEINLNHIKDSFSWDKYISSDLTGTLKFTKKNKDKKLAQAVSKIVFKGSDSDINFNFGIFNRDFPNESVRKEFVLDYDCYSKFPVNPLETDILEIVKSYNSHIETLFESSIKPLLRDIMNK